VQIDFLGIQAFLAIVECGTFGLAAARLHLTQTAISHRMRKLEDSLGVQLIVRTSRGVSLTQAGEALLPRARNSVRQLEESCDIVRKHGQNAPAWVSFGCVPTVAAGLLVPLLQRVQQSLPGLRIRVFDSTPGEIVELVQAGTVAFGVSIAQSVPEALAQQPIGQERFVLAVPREHALARQPAVDWAQLEAERLIRISLPSGNSATIDESLGPLRERLQWVYEAQRTAMALEMVAGGLGATVVPALSVAAGHEGIAVVPLRGPVVMRTLVLLTPGPAPLRGPEQFIAETLAGLVRERLGALATPP